MRAWQPEVLHRASCFAPRWSTGKQQRVITYSAVDEADAMRLKDSDCGSGHLVKSGSVWASIIVTAAAELLHGSVSTSAA